MTETEKKQEFKYDVFISYRHAELDNAVAGYLQKALEHYHIPREIQKKCGKKNIRRVFRDEEELGVASDLFGEIEQNLKQSEFLLVICSPRILESKWCMREIETFIRYRGRDNVLAVLIEGEPETAFPAILREEGEPLAADLRGKNKREVLRHAKQRMARLAAPLLYCSYDELYQRHRVYKMRRMVALAGAVTALSLIFGAVTVFQNREITKNYQSKLENQSRYLAQTAQDLFQSGDRDAALLVALEALPKSSEDTSRPYVAEARIALEQALYTYSINLRFQLKPMKLLEHKGALGNCSDYNEQEKVLLTSDTRIYVWDADTLENLCCWEDESRNYQDAKLVGNHCVAALTDTGVLCFQYLTGEIVWEWERPVCDTSDYCSGALVWDFDPVSGRILCACSTISQHHTPDYQQAMLMPGHYFYLLDAATGESTPWLPQELFEPILEDPYETVYLNQNYFAFSPDGKYLAVMVRSYDENYQTTNELYILPVEGDESIRIIGCTGGINPLELLVWLDEESLGIVYTLEGGVQMGIIGQECTWRVLAWNIFSGQPWLTHDDTCIALMGNVSMQKVLPQEGYEGTIPVLCVVHDNVEICLDWYTGERYSRIEDRSSIMLNHVWESKNQVIVTADGYLFHTSPTEDRIWAKTYTAYHYYIGNYLGSSSILKAEWYNNKAFFFTAAGVYCYAPMLDSSYALLTGAVGSSFFTEDSQYVLVQDTDGVLSLYETEEFGLEWQETGRYNYNLHLSGSYSALLLDEQYAVYLDPEEQAVLAYRFREGTSARVELPGCVEGTSVSLNLRQAGEGQVLVWNSDTTMFSSFSEPKLEQLDFTAVWLVDLEREEVLEQWSYEQLVEGLPERIEREQTINMTVDAVSATRDGRYVLMLYGASGYPPKEGDGLYSFIDRFEQKQLALFDRESGDMVPLPEELDGLADTISGTYLAQDGWLSPTQAHTAVFYDDVKKLLLVADLEQGTVLHTLAVDGVSSTEVSFTPDGEHLIFQDGNRCLCVYDWKNGAYTLHGVTPEVGSFTFSFWQGGEVLCALQRVNMVTSNSVKLYNDQGGGVYKLETSISYCKGCDGKTVVIDDSSYPRLYHAYSLDDLIAQAREILNGRELTELERLSYLID